MSERQPGLKASYRTEDGKAQIDWELEPREKGLVFSATGDYDGSSGQCLDDIGKAYPEDAIVQRLVAIWGEWHLNDMRGGTPEQEAAVKDWAASYDPNAKAGHYDQAVFMLKARGLYEIPTTTWICQHAKGGHDREMYRYGEKWLFHAIPEAIIDELRALARSPENVTLPLHEYKARLFLHNNDLRLSFTRGSKPAPWSPSGLHYRVRISAKRRPPLSFDWFGSAAMQEENRDPTDYDILSTCASEIDCPETFEEYCREFGEDTDSRSALETFKKLSRFSGRLRKFFSEAEQEQLQEVR